MDKNMRPYMAELIGTFVVVFIGAGAVCVNQMAAIPRPAESAAVIVQSPLGVVGIALAQGLALAVALAATVHLTGGFLNPAITLMLWVYKRLDGGKTTALIAAQLVGAAVAGGLLRALYSFNETVMRDSRLGATHVNLNAFGVAGVNGRALFSGIGVEIILTFILTFAIFGTMIDPRAPRLLGRVGKWLSGLWVGLVAMAMTLVAFQYTGAAANPARWFGPAIWEMTVPSLQLQHPFADHMVYWIGPIVGSLLAGGIYTSLILPPEEERMPATSTVGGKVAAGAGSTLFRAKK